MAVVSIELGKKYHCREEMSEAHTTGIFYIDPVEGIRLRLVAYDKSNPVKYDEYFIVRTEDNFIVSLHNNVFMGSGSVASAGSKTYSFSLISNLAIVGHDQWTPDQLVRTADFRVMHSESSLRRQKQVDALVDSEIGDRLDSQIFSLNTAGLRISAYFVVSFSPGFSTHPTKLQPRFSIEFDEGISLANYRRRVQSIARFFSALTGIQLRASEILISRLQKDEQLKLVQQGQYPDIHDVYEHDTKEDESVPLELWVGHQFAFAWNDDELSALTACLEKWMQRDLEWERATQLMWESLSLDGEMTSTRLMAAYRWFDAIPGTKAIPCIKADDIRTIAAAANAKATELGYADISKRICGSLDTIRKESNADRFTRLAKEITAVFGENFLGKDFINHLEKATILRGKVAHGYFEPESGVEFSEFTKVVSALECLCYLLTIKDLPISVSGKDRVKGLPIIRNYLLSATAP